MKWRNLLNKDYLKDIGFLLLAGVVVLALIRVFLSSLLLFVLGVVVVVGLCVWNAIKTKRSRERHPKDYAFLVYLEWNGSATRLAWLQKKLPQIEEYFLKEWMKEFEEAEMYISRLVSAGGSQVLGVKRVRLLLQEKHPFLVGMGLQKAEHEISYNAWHEGYSEKPELKVEEI
jgi:hypothetical protein